MTLRVAIQADPLPTLNRAADTSLELAREAQARGYRLWWYTPEMLSWEDGRLTARARALTLHEEREPWFTLGAPEVLDLATMDVVLMRQDPPFDMAYVTAAHLLERLEGTTLVLNNPREVRNAPEKLFVTERFAAFHPPTLLSADLEALRDFHRRHGEIVLKPVHGFGGHGVFHLRANDDNLAALVELFARINREPLIAQKFLPEVRTGDKRVILIDGKVEGVLIRTPATGEIRANLRAGGSGTTGELTAREREICAAVGPELAARGILLAGIDLIGGWLTEINVTSPTGLAVLRTLTGTPLAPAFWDAVMRRLKFLTTSGKR